MRRNDRVAISAVHDMNDTHGHRYVKRFGELIQLSAASAASRRSSRVSNRRLPSAWLSFFQHSSAGFSSSDPAGGNTVRSASPRRTLGPRCREIRRVVQDNAEFLTELGLECVQQPDRCVAVEILLTRQEERLVSIAHRTQQLDRVPRARHRQ